jgi:hypothetical protein
MHGLDACVPNHAAGCMFCLLVGPVTQWDLLATFTQLCPVMQRVCVTGGCSYTCVCHGQALRSVCHTLRGCPLA